jgi:hypothetical protein
VTGIEASVPGRHGADGVIRGHIHHAVVEEIDDIRYINSGDWVESCTAVVEDHQGGFSIVRWTAPVLLSLKSQPAETARAAARTALSGFIWLRHRRSTCLVSSKNEPVASSVLPLAKSAIPKCYEGFANGALEMTV